MTLSTIIYITIFLVIFNFILVAVIFLNKIAIHRRKIVMEEAENYFLKRYVRMEEATPHCQPGALMRAYKTFFEQVVVNPEARQQIYQDFSHCGIIQRNIKNLNSASTLKRKTAASNLSYFMSPDTKYALINRLKIEKRANIKIYIINSLKNQMDQLTLLALIESVVGSKKYYQSRAIQIIKNYLLTNRVHIPDVFNRNEPEIRELFVDLAESVFRDDFKVALLKELKKIEDHFLGIPDTTYSQMVTTRIKRLYYRILSVLSNIYEFDLSIDRYLKNNDEEVVKIAISSIAKIKTFEQLQKLLSMVQGGSLDNHIAEVIQSMIEANIDIYLNLVELFKTELSPKVSSLIANVLSSKIDYLALKMKNNPDSGLDAVLLGILEAGYNASLIAFLNVNRDRPLETMILNIIKPLTLHDEQMYQDLNDYLDPAIFSKMGFKKEKTPKPAKVISDIEISKVRWLRWIFLFSLLFFPLIFLVLRLRDVLDEPLDQWLETFILLVNNSLVYYYLIVNGVYIVLALLSANGARKQRILWDIKSRSMLYEKGILASISIIAPAYNEEISIIDSVTSLLNLKYPDYEVIVVNDGSQDRTLEKLIEHFSLERRNVPIKSLINTKQIKAVYKNKNIPNLTIVDKVNGGKADALNVGINTARNEYVCGIDADSLLAPEALLKLMSSALDHDEITLALGGNIFPVNGSIVSDGYVEQQKMSTQPLAALQTLEYLRAFTLGRLGWSELNSLLIISGAFGLFEKRILTEVGGYLTTQAFKKNTVGEDMELVVRVSKHAYEKHLNFRVDYLYNAICYTEVPEKFKIFQRQRNRWQRGLVDILSYHRKMIFNPKYRQAGMLAMPYYFLFEMVGPLLEIQGIFALIVSGILGLLSLNILLLLLTTSISLGITLSLLSLLVTERNELYFDKKDTFRMVLLAILENFGWRQFISMYRVVGFFASMKANQSWGVMTRTGFKK